MKHPNPGWFKRTSMAAIVAGLLVAVLGLAANPASASVQDPTPTPYSDDEVTGTTDCADYGIAIEAKIDSQPEEGTYDFDELAKKGAVPEDLYITISNVESPGGRMEFDWSSNYAFSLVLVKQSNGGLAYEYAPAVTSDQNVQTVEGQNSGGISHVTFCGPVAPAPVPTASAVECAGVEGAPGIVVTLTNTGNADAVFAVSQDGSPVGDLETRTVTDAENTETLDLPQVEDVVTNVVVTSGAYSAPFAFTSNCSTPQPQAVLGASVACAESGLTVTVTNSGDGAGTADVLSGDTLVADDLAVPAKGSAQVAVAAAEGAPYKVTAAGVLLEGVRDCEEVEGVVIVKTPETPVTPAVEVAGVQITRAQELPRTGSTTLPLIQVGLGLMLIGAGALIIGKDQTASI